MSELLLPGNFQAGSDDGTPFNRAWFVENFHSDQAPRCELYAEGDIPVVELELMNGETCDVYYFEAFRKQMLVALLFVDPPSCEQFYQSFIRYETIFRVNIRYYHPPQRALGFKAAHPTLKDDDDLERPVLKAVAKKD